MLERIVGSKGRVALLRALFDGRCQSVHIRELARKAELSAPSLMREAKNLVNMGLLKEVRDGNRVDYSANSDSPLYAPLLSLVEKTSGPIALLKEAFADSAADFVFVYGSRARGTERADSDIDLFVIGNEGLRKVSSRISSVAERVDVEVNPYVISSAELKRRLAAGDHFLNEVMASPKIFLKGDENGLAGMAQVWLAEAAPDKL